jgi:hypothetical protein
MARWECTIQKVWRKDIVPCMSKLEEIVVVFEEVNEVEETNGCSLKQNSIF